MIVDCHNTVEEKTRKDKISDIHSLAISVFLHLCTGKPMEYTQDHFRNSDPKVVTNIPD